MAWYDFVQENRAEELQRASREALGRSPEDIRIDGQMTSHEFDDQGKPINRMATAETRYDVDPGYGLLADPDSSTNWMKYATDIMGTVKGSKIGAAMMGQLNAGAIAINKAEHDNNMTKRNIDFMAKDIWGGADDGKPAGQPPARPMAPLANQVTQNVQGAQPPVPMSPQGIPQAQPSPQEGARVSPQGSPVISDSRAPTQPMQAESPRDKWINSDRKKLLNKLMYTGLSGGSGVKAALESQIKAGDVRHGYGEGATTTSRDYAATQRDPAYAKWFMDQKKAGAVNLANQTVDLATAKGMRNAAGDSPPLGMPLDQLTPQGYYPVDAAAVKKDQQYKTGTSVVTNIEDKLFGKNGIFMEDGKELPSGFIDRLKASPKGIWDYYSQDDVRIRDYEDYKIGVLSPFVKSLGEVGALAEGDVERALKFFPDLYPIPDTPEMARIKIKNMRGLIEKGDRISALQKQFKIVKGQSQEGMTYVGGDPRAEGNYVPDAEYDAYKPYSYVDYKGK